MPGPPSALTLECDPLLHRLYGADGGESRTPTVGSP